MSKSILFIDGENFLHKIDEVFKAEGLVKDRGKLASINLNLLFKDPLKGLSISKKIFYAAKLYFDPETKKKSEELIKSQRKLRNNLVAEGYEFVIAGNVRGQKVGDKIVFREKGVDVRIGVDLVSLACDKKLETAILCSSDSDLQPAIAELKKRDVEVVYLGFETNPNRGLTYTADRTILLRNHEILAALPEN